MTDQTSAGAGVDDPLDRFGTPDTPVRIDRRSGATCPEASGVAAGAAA